MITSTNLTISIKRVGNTDGEYLIELMNEGDLIAEEPVSIDRQILLEHEQTYSAHDYGMELFDAVFTGKVRRDYQSLVGSAGSDTTIRIQLVISNFALELHALPWERLFHTIGRREAPLAISAQTPFSRFLITGAGKQTTGEERPLRLLVAIANPKGLPAGMTAIDVTAEVSALADLLKIQQGHVIGTLLHGHTEIPPALRQQMEQKGWRIIDGVTSWSNIQRQMSEQHAHILHILSHGQFREDNSPGKATASLLLEHEGDTAHASGTLRRVADTEIIAGLEGVRPLPQLIFLAACESARRPLVTAATPTGVNPFVGLGPKLAEAGVPAIIAMQDLVPMDVARTLTGDFYRRLFAHGQVDLALNESRSLVYKSNQFKWAIPVLFLRLQGGQLFSTCPDAARKEFEPEMVFVSGGPFPTGSQPAVGVADNETPQHSVNLASYYIGKYPVTNQQYAEFIRRVKTQNVPDKADWFNRKPPSSRLDHPVTGVSWHDAVAYCDWLRQETGRHYRLPSAAELEKAARGTQSQPYPWGEEWVDGYANVGSLGTTPVAAHPLGSSPFGCQDLLGNVEEWTRSLCEITWSSGESTYNQELVTADNLPSLGKVVCQGGSYRSAAGIPYCTLRRCADPGSKLTWRGFRVVIQTEVSA